jgi:hypothetical protein
MSKIKYATEPFLITHYSSASRLSGQLILFALLVTVYTLTNAGLFHIIDEVSLFAVTESLGQRGAVDTNAIAWSQWVNSPGEVLGAFGPDGEVYSKKGPAPAFTTLPWYLLMRGLASLGLPLGLLQGTLLWNGVITALTALLLWLTALRLGYSDRTGATLGLLFGLGTIAWPYANHLFGEPLSAFSLLLCFYGLVAARRRRGAEATIADDGQQTTGHGRLNTQHATRNTQHVSRPYLWLAGIGAGLAIATVTAHALLIALFGIYLIVFLWRGGAEATTVDDGRRTTDDGQQTAKHVTRNPQHISRFTFHISQITHYGLRITPFLLPILITLLLLGWYNLVRFGHPLETGYHFERGEGFTTPFWQGFWGLVGSPYRGLFWHTPLFFATLLAFPDFLRRHRAEGILIVGLSILLIALYSTWWMWWGGFAWGPRFLVPLASFWVLSLAPLVERMMNQESRIRLGVWRALALPILYSSIFILSFLVQLSAVLVNYVNYEIELRRIFPTDWEDPLRFGPPAQAIGDLAYSPVVGQWLLMAQDFTANTDLAWLWADGTVLWPVVISGGIALLLLSGLFVHWWRWFSLKASGDESLTGSRPVVARQPSVVGRRSSVVAIVLCLLVLAIWLTSVADHPHYGREGVGYRAILAEVGAHAGDGDLLLTIAPYHYQIPMNWFGGIYPGGLSIIGYATDSVVHAKAVEVLARRLQSHPQIWFVTAGLPPADPSNHVERWLAKHAYKADDRWFADFRLVRYGTPATLEGAPVRPLGVTLSDAQNRVALSGVQKPAVVASGAPLPVEIHYQAAVAADPLRWFVQLLGPEGQLVAQVDMAPLHGYSAFPELVTGVEAVERVALILPAALAAGEYQLIAGIYNPTVDGTPRLRSETNQDFVDLGRVVVERQIEAH